MVALRTGGGGAGGLAGPRTSPGASGLPRCPKRRQWGHRNTGADGRQKFPASHRAVDPLIELSLCGRKLPQRAENVKPVRQPPPLACPLLSQAGMKITAVQRLARRCCESRRWAASRTGDGIPAPPGKAWAARNDALSRARIFRDKSSMPRRSISTSDPNSGVDRPSAHDLQIQAGRGVGHHTEVRLRARQAATR